MFVWLVGWCYSFCSAATVQSKQGLDDSLQALEMGNETDCANCFVIMIPGQRDFYLFPFPEPEEQKQKRKKTTKIIGICEDRTQLYSLSILSIPKCAIARMFTSSNGLAWHFSLQFSRNENGKRKWTDTANKRPNRVFISRFQAKMFLWLHVDADSQLLKFYVRMLVLSTHNSFAK